jgi:hypothetical protein
VTSVQTARTTAYVVYYCIFREANAVFIARLEEQTIVIG